MPETRPATGASALVVSTVATAAALGVLVVSSQIHLLTLAAGLRTWCAPSRQP